MVFQDVALEGLPKGAREPPRYSSELHVNRHLLQNKYWHLVKDWYSDQCQSFKLCFLEKLGLMCPVQVPWPRGQCVFSESLGSFCVQVNP